MLFTKVLGPLARAVLQAVGACLASRHFEKAFCEEFKKPNTYRKCWVFVFSIL